MLKHTMLFQAGTIDADGNAARIGGFSESWYTDLSIDSTPLAANSTRLCQLRAALLPSNCRIVGQRIQSVDPVGASRGYDTVFPGTQTSANDLPQVALQFSMRSATGFNNRQVVLRAIPDIRVLKGEYYPSDVFNAALVAFFGELQANWKMRAIDRTVLPIKIVSIDANGLVTTEGNHGLAAGNAAQFMSMHVGDLPKFSGKLFVVNAPSANTFTVRLPFPYTGLTGHGGRVRKYGIDYLGVRINPSEIISPVAVTRKVGAPFRKFRGRRTAKKS